MYSRIKRTVVSGCMILSLIIPSVQVGARENEGAYVNDASDRIEIGNQDISRLFLVEDGHVVPGAVENRRIDQTLTPEAGSELFLLNTIFEAEGEETLPQEALARSSWTGQVSCEDSSQVKDAGLMFDGDNNTDVDYYVTGTDFPYTLTIDLGQEMEMNRAAFSVYADKSDPVNYEVYTDFKIQYEKDGQWIDAYASSEGTHKITYTVFNGTEQYGQIG